MTQILMMTLTPQLTIRKMTIKKEHQIHLQSMNQMYISTTM